MEFPKRKIYPNQLIVDYPEEVGYSCPINPKHQTTWSEYEGHIWCYDCEKDIPSCFCKPTLEENIEIFYSLFNNLGIQTMSTASENTNG